MENGMWYGKNCNHVTDVSFGNELAKVMKERGIRSVVDLGCGRGHYIKQLAIALGNNDSRYSTGYY